MNACRRVPSPTANWDPGFDTLAEILSFARLLVFSAMWSTFSDFSVHGAIMLALDTRIAD